MGWSAWVSASAAISSMIFFFFFASTSRPDFNIDACDQLFMSSEVFFFFFYSTALTSILFVRLMSLICFSSASL